MGGIFINYRRNDAPGVAGRLYDHLAKDFSRHELFIDVDAMRPGIDFVQQLDAQVSKCDALLAIIGPHWLTAKDNKGGRRLDQDNDYVRIELASALKRDIPVIPVLVEGVSMPPETDLPQDLKSLARRQALELRHTRFAADADAIAAALKSTLPRRRRSSVRMATVAAALVGLVALGVGVYHLIGTRVTQPTQGVAPPGYQPESPPSGVAERAFTSTASECQSFCDTQIYEPSSSIAICTTRFSAGRCSYWTADCDEYARLGVLQTQDHLNRNCPTAHTDYWTLDYEVHYRWCNDKLAFMHHARSDPGGPTPNVGWATRQAELDNCP